MDISKQVCTIEQGKRLRALGIKGHSFMGYSWTLIIQVDEEGDLTGAKLPCLSLNTSDIPGAELEGLLINDQGVPHGYPDGEEIETYADYPAFTVAELGQMLNSETYTIRTGTELSAYANWEWIDQGNGEDNGGFDTEAEARAAMLIEMLKSKLITADQANERLNA